MKTPTLQWFPQRWATAVLLLAASTVPLFGAVPNRVGRIEAKLILDGGATPGNAAFDSFFSTPAEEVLQYGVGQLVDGSWNISGQSPKLGDFYPLGPCGSTTLVPYPYTAPTPATKIQQPESISANLPLRLPTGNYGGKFVLQPATDQKLNSSGGPLTPGAIDDLAVPYWVNLRHDLTPSGRKSYYAESFHSNPLLPWDVPNQDINNPWPNTPVDVHTITEAVGALHVEVYCPALGTSLLKVKSAFITAILSEPPIITLPSCLPAYPGQQPGSAGTIQATVRLTPADPDVPEDLKEKFLVRANRSYMVTVEFTVGDLDGDITAKYSALTATPPVLQGDIVYVRIDVDKLFCDQGPTCHSDLGRMEMIGAMGKGVFMNPAIIPPRMRIEHGPFETGRDAFMEDPLLDPSPLEDPNGVLYNNPVPNYRLKGVLPSVAVWPQVWTTALYTGVF